MCLKAEKYVFSSSKNPFPNQAQYASEIAYQKRPRKQAEIFTSNDKFIIEITDPVKDKCTINFTTKNNDFLNSISINETIISISIPMIGGMRECFVKKIDKKSGFVEIETYIKIG